QALAMLARAVRRLGLPVWLERVPRDSAFIPAIADAMRGRGLVVVRPQLGCPWIALDSAWTRPIECFNAGRRSDFRRMLRRADQRGRVEYQVCCPTFGDLDRLLDEAFRVEAASWKGRTGTALAADAPARRFFVHYAVDACARGMLRIGFMRIDGR